MFPRTRAFAGGLALVVVGGAFAGGIALSPEVKLGLSSGDWRAATEGLRRARGRGTLAGGPRAVVHFHGPGSGPGHVALRLSLRDAALPVSLAVTSGGETLFSGTVPQQPLLVEGPVPPGNAGADLFLEAEPERETGSALYLVHEIALRRKTGLRERAGQVLPGIAGVAVYLLLWSRGRRWAAVGWALLSIAALTGVWMLAVDTQAPLRWHPVTRERLRIAAVACAWALGLAPARPRLAALAAILATVGFLHGSAAAFGLLSDDFLWARPWSWGELLATAAGPEDPQGLTQGGYRPLASWSRALDHWMWGTRPAGYHVTNLALHALNGLLAWVFLGRLGLSDRAALAGALAWISHPLAASSVAWLAQRTDGLMAAFYLGALILLLSPRFERAHAYGLVGLGALALASKEMAVTLPVAAWLVALLFLPREERRRRMPAVRSLGLLLAAYLALWVGLFAEKVVVRIDRRFAWTGFDATRVESWARALPALYAPVFAPTGYAEWWNTNLLDWPPLYLGLAAAVAPVAAWALRHCRSCVGGARVAALGAVWALVTIAPALAVPPDLYRLGLLVCLGFGLVFGALIQHAEHRSPPVAVGLAVACAAWLTPIAAGSASAWGPGGLRAERATAWGRTNASWQAHLPPEGRRAFWEQIERREHARVWTESAPAAAAPQREGGADNRLAR